MILIIIIVTSLISYIAFRNKDIMYKFQFNAYQIYHRREIYRFISHAFLHADMMHLFVNMLVLYSFSDNVMSYFRFYFGGKAILYMLILYFGSIVFSTLYTFIKHRDNPHYNAVGASGAVSAVLFTSIFFTPMHKVLFFGVIPIPGIIFGVAYMIYSYIMSKRSRDNIAHDVHFWGGVYGFVFPILLKPELLKDFINQII